MNIKFTIAAIFTAVLLIAAGAYVYERGVSAGKEESQLDRIETRLKTVESDVGDLKSWKSRFGRGQGSQSP
jgi:hypothetical protein